ncbi:hypothetical protein [Burkholderia territorii]|uniref:hypothetical protein n=1 Tax=Burkholderia territorii TaxID=1503055 RepID=UPI0012D9693C|nr:hypothetical protein [Burkholderia territorii]
MNILHDSDRFMVNLFVAAWITCSCGLLLLLWSPRFLEDAPLRQVGAAAASGAAVNLLAPTIWRCMTPRSRQPIFTDEHHERAAQLGRWIGVALGVVGVLMMQAM